MSWSLKEKGEGDVKLYKFYSSISGEFLNENWLTREECIKHIFWHKIQKLAEETIKETSSFPFGWTEHETGKRIMENKDGLSEVYDFIVRSSNEEFYDRFLNDLKMNGLSFNINDGISQISNEEEKDTISIEDAVDFIANLNDYINFPSPTEFEEEHIVKNKISKAIKEFKTNKNGTKH